MPRTAVTNRFQIKDFGTSLYLDGTDDYLARNGENVYNNSSYWISFWIKAMPITDKTIYGECSSTDTNPIFAIGTGQLSSTNNKLSVFIRNVEGSTKLNFVTTTKVIFDCTWHHILWVDDNGTCTMYVDNIADVSNFNYTKNGTFLFDRVGVGARVRASAGNFMKGYLDKFRTGTGTLTQTDRDNLFYRDTLPSGTNINLELDEGAGTTAQDSTTNNLDFTITGATYMNEVFMKPRKEVNGNLVKNGGFEYVPPYTADTTGSNRWLDGTAGGSTTNTLFNWKTSVNHINASTIFDSTVKYSGNYSLKINVSTATAGTSGNSVSTSTTVSPSIEDQRLLIPVRQSTSYTFTGMIKTENITNFNGAGARFRVLQYSGVASPSVGATDGTYFTGTNDWTLVTFTFTTGASTNYANIWCSVFNESGIAWFDEITLKPTIPEERQLATGRQAVI